MNQKLKNLIFGESWLTKQERLVLQVVLALLLTGWAVKTYRLSHPPKQAAQVEEAKK